MPQRPDFRGGGIGEAIAANQRLEHVMTLLEHILETMQRIEEQGKPKPVTQAQIDAFQERAADIRKRHVGPWT